VLAHEWRTIPERGVVKSREPFKFWWSPTISLEWLMMSGAVNLVGWSKTHCGKLVTVSVTRLLHWLSTSVYNTVGLRHCVARVCQRQQRLVFDSDISVSADNCYWNKMQSEKKDFVPGPATWRTGRNVCIVSDFVHSLYYVKTWMSSTNPEIHNISHSRQKRTKPRPQLTCTENWMCGF